MMEEKLGRIQNGYLADIIAINLDQPHLYPTGNLVNTLVAVSYTHLAGCGAKVGAGMLVKILDHFCHIPR